MNNLGKRIFTSLILFSILLLSFYNIHILTILLLFINFIAIAEIKEIFEKIFKKNYFYKFLFLILSVIYLSFFSLLIYFFLNITFDINKYNLLFILLIIFSTDIGGFLFGKIIGGKKLTKISPNKTYSGTIGSMFFSLIVGLSTSGLQNKILIIDFNLVIFILTISIISQLGDLFFSFLKRKAKIKDTGSILPGHGGILDRIDGILLALPVGIIYFF